MDGRDGANPNPNPNPNPNLYPYPNPNPKPNPNQAAAHLKATGCNSFHTAAEAALVLARVQGPEVTARLAQQKRDKESGRDLAN